MPLHSATTSRPDAGLRSRRFVPYFLTQALGAYNDNTFRFSVMFLLTYRLDGSLPLSINVLMNLAAGLFILPFLLFSNRAGRWADQGDQARLARRLKWLELCLMLVAAIGFWSDNWWLLLALVFFMGSQSALFGPLKYAILPRQLDRTELVRANGWVGMGTFLAILLGTLTGGLLPGAGAHAGLLAAILVVVIALLGLLAAQFIPAAPPPRPLGQHRGIGPRPIESGTIEAEAIDRGATGTWAFASWRLFRGLAPRSRGVILLISWFWFIGAGYLTQFPNFAHAVLGATASGATLLLALFALGVGTGALVTGYLTRDKPRLGVTPWAAIAIGFLGVHWYLQARNFVPGTTLLSPAGLEIGADIFLTGLAGGVFIVPLYSYLQRAVRPRIRAQAIATLNVFNAVFMVLSAGFGLLLFGLIGITLPTFFLLFGSSGFLIAALWWLGRAA